MPLLFDLEFVDQSSAVQLRLERTKVRSVVQDVRRIATDPSVNALILRSNGWFSRVVPRVYEQ